MLILVTSLQNCLANFCNLFSVNLENFSTKGNLKYRIFSLVLLGSVSLGFFMIFVFKYLLTDLWINLGGYSFFFCKITFSFLRSKWKTSHLLFKRKIWSIKDSMKRNHEKLKLNKELDNFRNTINRTEWYLLIQAIQKKVKYRNIQIAKTREIKLSNWTHNKVLPFSPDDVIINLSSYRISHEEANILK